jgi:hypothetical protein
MISQIRTLRLRGKDREEYVRASLSAMKIQQLRHVMAESGVTCSNTMRKEEMVEEISKFVLGWAETAEAHDELESRNNVQLR